MMKNKQIEFWKGTFGINYTNRNTLDLKSFHSLYMKTYGVTFTDMYKEFFKKIPKDIKILEVGCNTGMQLLCLQEIGFKNLYGIEIQDYAVNIAQKKTNCINIIQANGFDIPFKDGFFDLVFTAGVLIHIDPSKLKNFTSEIVRCSKNYILGFEYYSDIFKPVVYRRNKNVLWKGDYCKFYLEHFSNLILKKKKFYKYLENKNVDYMFLLEKI